MIDHSLSPDRFDFASASNWAQETSTGETPWGVITRPFDEAAKHAGQPDASLQTGVIAGITHGYAWCVVFLKKKTKFVVVTTVRKAFVSVIIFPLGLSSGSLGGWSVLHINNHVDD